MRRMVVSVIGDAGVKPGSATYETAREVGSLLVDAGFRVMTGGLGGVMEAASRGAHESGAYSDGATIGVLPHLDPAEANEWVDIVLATGLDHARNTLVANADAVIAVGGGAGTLSEIAFAWMFKRLVVALKGLGWADRLAGERLDARARCEVEDDRVYSADDARQAVAIVVQKLPLYGPRNKGFRPAGR
ncbi:MAG: TIGR00725 family protein [Polyangiaceae bacterium]